MISSNQTCAFCNEPLTEKNRSKEHIIPNSIGGRKKTTNFICNTCNTKCGESWDSDLAKQLNWFSSVVGISRERGEPPKQSVQTVKGEKYCLLSDGTFTLEKSSYTEEHQGGAVRIKMTAKTPQEAKTRLKGVIKKYPKLNPEKVLNELKNKTYYLDSPLNVEISFGGDHAGRSLVKTAFAFASACDVPHEACDKAIEYLRDENSKAIPFGFAYLSDFIQNRPEDKIFHCVSLRGDPKTKKLWSYIEYFGIFRVVVLLSDSYGGESKNEIYSLDPINGSEMGIKVRDDVSDEELALICSGNCLNQENHIAAVDYALRIIMERDRSRALEREVKEGFDHAAKQLGIKKGELIPNEVAAEFVALMMAKMSPYIESLVSDRRSALNKIEADSI